MNEQTTSHIPPDAGQVNAEPDLAGTSWEQQPRESSLWYSRFAIYRDLGPTRTIEAAFRSYSNQPPTSKKRPGSQWYSKSKDWHWNQRAVAWDNEQRRLIRNAETDRRLHAREERIEMTTILLSQLFENMTPDWLADLSPMQTRIFFLSLLQSYRHELPPPLYDPATAESIEFTADELSTAYAQLQEWRADQEHLSGTWPPDHD